jgi:nucleoside-diphosphate-sugar epimerase
MLWGMRIFLAGASGVLGIRLLPLLVAAGHEVAAMTRSPGKAAELERLGGQPVVCDVYDRAALRDAVRAFAPDAVMHQLTDLPDDSARMRELSARNDRIRTEGTRNLVEAAGTARVYAQSIAWELPPERAGTIVAHERMVLDAGGVVLRYGQLYGPGTYYEADPPPPPRIAVDAAAERTPALLGAASGIYELVEDG